MSLHRVNPECVLNVPLASFVIGLCEVVCIQLYFMVLLACGQSRVLYVYVRLRKSLLWKNKTFITVFSPPISIFMFGSVAFLSPLSPVGHRSFRKRKRRMAGVKEGETVRDGREK